MRIVKFDCYKTFYDGAGKKYYGFNGESLIGNNETFSGLNVECPK